MGATSPTVGTSAPSAVESWRMFDRIAFRYDLLNRLLSFRQDVGWRRVMAQRLPEGNQLRVLDLATGTCDALLSLHRQSGRIAKGVGLDMSANMLSLGREKLRRHGLHGPLTLMRADAENIAFSDESFDAATIAFGIRNVPDVPKALRDIRRILKPRGRTLILEFSLPSNRLFRKLYLFYFRHVLPTVGGLVSGERSAYQYLNESVEHFPYGDSFCELLRDAGFHNVKATPLSFGIATLYEGEK